MQGLRVCEEREDGIVSGVCVYPRLTHQMKASSHTLPPPRLLGETDAQLLGDLGPKCK